MYVKHCWGSQPQLYSFGSWNALFWNSIYRKYYWTQTGLQGMKGSCKTWIVWVPGFCSFSVEEQFSLSDTECYCVLPSLIATAASECAGCSSGCSALNFLLSFAGELPGSGEEWGMRWVSSVQVLANICLWWTRWISVATEEKSVDGTVSRSCKPW